MILIRNGYIRITNQSTRWCISRRVPKQFHGCIRTLIIPSCGCNSIIPGCIRTFIILSSDCNLIILGCIVRGDEYIYHKRRKARKEISKKRKEISEETRKVFLFASGCLTKPSIFFHIFSFCFFAEDEFPQAVGFFFFFWGLQSVVPKSCNEDRTESHAFWLHLIPMKVS